MHRIDTTSRAQNLFGTGKDGFTKGDAVTGVEATEVSADILNAIQEEIANVIEGAGDSLIKGDRRQLFRAVRNYSANISLLKNYIDKAPGTAVPIGVKTGVVAGGIASYKGLSYQVAGSSGAVKYITPSIGWSNVTLNAPAYSGVFYGSVWTGSVYLTVGSLGEIRRATTIGGALSRMTPGSSYAGTFYDVAHDGAGLFAAVGAAGEIQTSPDGTTWTSQTAGSGYADKFYAVASSGSLWMAVGAQGEVQTSADGVTWNRKSTGGVDYTAVEYDSNNSIWFMSSTSAVHKTADEGATLVSTTLTSFTSCLGIISSALLDATVVFGYGAFAITIDAGATWSMYYVGNNDAQAVARGEGMFSVFGVNGSNLAHYDSGLGAI